ncbi:MAG: DUF6036 family nucleotidyltransferase [Pseudomonadota bacterium]
MKRVIDSKETFLGLVKELDARLEHPLEIFVVGGAGLVAHGFIERGTDDVDVISPQAFPEEALEAIQAIAKRNGIPLDWINTRPAHLEKLLAKGWKERAALFSKGHFLKVWVLGRRDLLGLKLVAAIERFDDREDLLAIKPSKKELEIARAWAHKYPANPGWKRIVDEFVKELEKDLRRD